VSFAIAICLSLVATINAGSKCGVSDVNVERSWKIIGGVDAKPLEFPWQVSVKNPSGSSHNCGGTIINNQWIMTAAHCPETTTIVLGDHNLKTKDGNEVQVGVDKWIIHPENKGDFKRGYDLTLVKLSEKLDFEGEHKHLAPICLATAEDDQKFAAPGAICTASGWGYTDFRGGHLADILQKLDVPIWDQQECADFMLDAGVILTERHICLGGLAEKGTCGGDSGGPLQCRRDDGSWVQVGANSFGMNVCATTGAPDGFTRISKFSEWIAETIANE